jgi:hypothetical protein
MTSEIEDNEVTKGAGGGRKSVGEGLPQILHNRARKSGEELHKLLLSFSTAILVIYFLALTAKTDPPLTSTQVPVCIVGLVAVGLAVLAGMICLLADTKRNYYRACALQAKRQEDRDKYFSLRNRWLSRQRWSSGLLLGFFVAGVAASIIYMIARVLSL